ncbi:MAG: hypothetical protein WCJ02_17645 [bacterium]
MRNICFSPVQSTVKTCLIFIVLLALGLWALERQSGIRWNSWDNDKKEVLQKNNSEIKQKLKTVAETVCAGREEKLFALYVWSILFLYVGVVYLKAGKGKTRLGSSQNKISILCYLMFSYVIISGIGDIYVCWFSVNWTTASCR